MSRAQWPKCLVALKNSSLFGEVLTDSAGAKHGFHSSREHEDASLKVVMMQPSHRKALKCQAGWASESHMLATLWAVYHS